MTTLEAIAPDYEAWQQKQGDFLTATGGHTRSIVFGRFLLIARLSWSPAPTLARVSRSRLRW